MVVEKIITRAKRAISKEADGAPKDVHARREVARFIHDKDVVKMLFAEIAQKVGSRPGGYTRVVKLGQRYGDGAHVAILELVDYNIAQEEKKAPAKPKRARRVRGKKSEASQQTETVKEETAASAQPETTPVADQSA